MNYYKDGTDYIPGYNPIITNQNIPDRYNPDSDDSRLSMEYEFNQDYIDDCNRINNELEC